MSSGSSSTGLRNEEEDVEKSANVPLAFGTENEGVSQTGTTSPTFTDHKALRMMEMMGYKSGTGLGKNKQGITEPPQLKPQLGKRGFGLELNKVQCSQEEWDFDQEARVLLKNVPTARTVTKLFLQHPQNVAVRETAEWLTNNDDFTHTLDEMKTWLKQSEPNLDMTKEHNFCDPIVLHKVLKGKEIFDELDLLELNQARVRANPFETIRSVFFMNRAALKMANIDAATNFMFTNIDANPHHMNNNKEPYYFADVCAGPGGFSEYILWRKKWMFKGFGLTLKGDNDFKVYESNCASPVTFLPLYGSQGDGNVCCPDNIVDFKEKIMFETDNKGVHFMMSDGGFSVKGHENLQEVLSKNIYICQCLVALEIVREHGHFVTKLFDTFTPFSVGLMYLMFKCFEKVMILKPNSSRPANSERYFICSDRKSSDRVSDIRDYLRDLARDLWLLKDTKDLSVMEVVPLDILLGAKEFFSYIYKMNNLIARRQSIHLEKLAAFCRNPLLVDKRQQELREACLQFWHIPDEPKVSQPKLNVDDLLNENFDKKELLLVQPREIKTLSQLKTTVTLLEDWHYAPLYCTRDTNVCNFYAGVGASKVYRLQGHRWVKVKNVQLTRGTLLWGELVKEKIVPFDEDTITFKYTLHVIDALRLGDVNLADLKFDERAALIQIYCKAINHEFRTNAIRVRPKVAMPLSRWEVLSSLERTETGWIFHLPILGYKTKDEFYDINSIILLKTGDHQSFQSTYVLRIQVFFSEFETSNSSCPLTTMLNFIKGMVDGGIQK